MEIRQKCLSFSMSFLTIFMSMNPYYIAACSQNVGLFSIESDAVGNHVTIWEEKELNIPVIKAAIYREGSWSEPITISNPNHQSIRPILEMDANGNAVALWRSLAKERNSYFLEAAKLLSGSDSWSSPEIISDIDETIITSSLKIKLNSNGNIIVMWCKLITDNNDPAILHKEIRASMSTFNTPWTPSTNINKGLN